MPQRIVSNATKHSREALARNLRRAREAKNLKQIELAHLMGYHGAGACSIVSRIETGVEMPRFAKLLKIAAALGLTVDQLIS